MSFPNQPAWPAKPLLEVRDLTVDYVSRDGATHRALDRVSFWVDAGEAVGVCGESGCGKTTTALALLGLLPPGGRIVNGSICLGGIDLLRLGERELSKVRGAQISLIFQEPATALNPVLRVGEQIAEVLRAHRRVSRQECRAEAEKMLAEVGFHDVARTYAAFPHQLSGGQRQRVAIAQALVCRPKLAIADEPTASLDSASQDEILALLRDLRDRLGIAFLIISHKPATLAALAHRVLRIHDGRSVEESSNQKIQAQPSHPHAGALLETFATMGSRAADQTLPTGKPRETPSLVSLHGLSKSYTQRGGFSRKHYAVQALCGVDLEIPQGMTLALVGPSGSGKSTLAKCLAGLERPDAGRILFEGRDLAARAANDRATAFRPLQLVFQDSATSLNPGFTAAEIIAEPLAIHRWGSDEQRMARAQELMAEVGLSPEWAARRPAEFSGGQRQRLAIARALAVQPKLLIFDEAFSGLDLLSQARVVNLLRELQGLHGLTYLLITHDLDLARNWADEIAVMAEGRVTASSRIAGVFLPAQAVEAPLPLRSEAESLETSLTH